MLANACFWVVFVIFFVFKSHRNVPHPPTFEERPTEFIYFGRALGYLENERMVPLIKVTRFVQRPSFYAASPFNMWFAQRGIDSEHLYHGVSVGGYFLLLVCLLSFLQWYVVGLFVNYISKHLRHHTVTRAG